MDEIVKTETMRDAWVYQHSTRLFKLYLLIWHRFKTYGAENIPDHGGVLIASNHASFIDPPAVGVGYRKRPVHFMARDTLWKPGFGEWWMNNVGCIPVARGTGDSRALKLTVKALKQGKVVSLFPEGTRTEDGELQKAKGGVGFIVMKSACTVIPTYIAGSYDAYPKGAKRIKPKQISIYYGKAITQEELAELGSGREVYDKIADLIMERIAELKKAAEKK